MKNYVSIQEEKPDNGDVVYVGVSEKPINPRIAIYKNGKFLDVSDNDIILHPTHWKYPNVPFSFNI